MQVSPKSASVQSVIDAPNPPRTVQIGRHNPCAAADNAPNSQGLHSQLSKGSNGRRRAANSLPIELAAGMEGPPAQPWCQFLQLRSCSAKPGTNVRNMSLQIFQLVHSQRCTPGFAPLRDGFERRGADPSIIGTGPRSTALEATEASSSVAMTCLKCTWIII